MTLEYEVFKRLKNARTKFEEAKTEMNKALNEWEKIAGPHAKTPASKGMDHVCPGNGCRYPSCENSAVACLASHQQKK